MQVGNKYSFWIFSHNEIIKLLTLMTALCGDYVKISTYVNGVWLHRTNALYNLGVEEPNKYSELAIGIIKEKILKAENRFDCSKKCLEKIKMINKVEKYCFMLNDLLIVSNEKR